jgi:hypothetical protein
MSRSTQFIGLTSRAEDFVKALEPLPPTGYAEGLAMEKIPLRRWKLPVAVRTEGAAHPNSTGTDEYIEETVQVSPWSSGPMIFTCLREVRGELEWNYFEWAVDPRLSPYSGRDYCRPGEEFPSEYDREAGVYCV